MVEIGLEIVE